MLIVSLRFFFVALEKKIYIEENYFVIYSLGAEIFMKMWSYYTSIQETKYIIYLLILCLKQNFDSELPYVLHLKCVLVHLTLQRSKIHSYCYHIRGDSCQHFIQRLSVPCRACRYILSGVDLLVTLRQPWQYYITLSC